VQTIYNQISCLAWKKKSLGIDYFSLYMHKKQNYFLFFLYTKYYNYSNGQLLVGRLKTLKYYKKSKKSTALVISQLNKKVYKKLNSINIFYCKNFNFKNYNWIKKYISLISPKINYMICTDSWNYITLKKKRIKRKIYRNIIKKIKTG
jgi:hypothetical protein